ncbi:MAG: hypothetical protein KDE33_05225 [Bacteroidetes bacterium]|nr:hypothetical protein [Bacteroidota bacterium]
MKQKIIFFLAIIFISLLLFNSCRAVYPSAEVIYLSGTEQTVTVRTIGIGTNEEKAIANAEQKIFDVLFFRGLPESNQKIPLIGSNEKEEKEKHKDYFNKFYANKRYKTFVMSSVPASSLTKVKSEKMLSVDVKVNLSALRSDLETFGIIRKFGY